MEKMYEQMDELVGHMESEKPHITLSKQFLLDSVIPQLMNIKYNEDKLEYIPHYVWNDLAVVPRIILACNDERIISAILMKNEMEKAGLTLKELMLAAVRNLEHIMGLYIVKSMKDVLKEAGYPVFEPEENNMHIVSNKYNRYGASALLFPKVFQSIAKKYDSDLIIFPSSVHELIVIPIKDNDTTNDPDEIVRSVNGTELAPHEILSDHVYYYIREHNQITIHMEQ